MISSIRESLINSHPAQQRLLCGQPGLAGLGDLGTELVFCCPPPGSVGGGYTAEPTAPDKVGVNQQSQRIILFSEFNPF